MKFSKIFLTGAMLFSSITPTYALGEDTDAKIPSPDLPEELRNDYVYNEALSDEFNGEVSDMWLMDYMPWWSDTAKREKSGTKTRYRFIDTDEPGNQSLQIYVNGENHMDAENFQPYYLEKLSGPRNLEVKDRYLANTDQKNNWNSKFAGFMAGGKNYLNTYRGSEAPIEHHAPYTDAGATTYGYFETRVKFLSMKGGQGLAPAFWFIGMQDEANDRGEVDAFEILDNHTLDFTIHPKGDPDITKVTKQFKFTEDLSQDYHTYGLLWDETGFSLYVDGKFMWKHNQKIDYRMIPMFSINHHENGWIGSTDGAGHPEERTMDIDYYRVYKKVGTDPEPNKQILPEMEEGVNVSKAAYISLFGLTGTEADATPVQWLNDGSTKQTVLSGLKNNVGETITESKLPEYLYIDWKKPGTFDTIILHAQNAQSMAPTLIDVEVSEDGTNWEAVKKDVKLEWTTNSQVAEAKTIELDSLISNNLFTRLVIKEANMKQGRFGLCEVEIGQRIQPMQPEYMPLPDSVDTTVKDSLFADWRFENDSIDSSNGLRLDYREGVPTFTDSVDSNGKALVVDGNTQKLYLPLELGDKHLKADEDFTLSMWINPEDVSRSDGDQIVLAQQTGAPGGRPWLFLYNGTLGTYIGGVNTFGSIDLSPNTWQHVAVTFRVLDKDTRTGEIKTYVNGVLDQTKEITYEADSDANPELLLGRHKNMSKGKYKGAMDQITLIQKALNPQDVAALYTANGKVEDIKGNIYEATSIVGLPEISGVAGEIKKDDIVLPDVINVVFDKTYSKDIPVVWNEQELNSINFANAGAYTIHGTLDLSSLPHVNNSLNLQAEQKIIINNPIDINGLKNILNRINSLIEKDYTVESFKAFLSACQSVQTKETLLMIGKYPNYSTPEIIPASATQEAINMMVVELEKAIELLVPASIGQDVVATTDLEKQLKMISSLDEKKYTKESWDALQEVVKEAKELLANKNKTQDQVDAMLEELKVAQSALKENSVNPSIPTDPEGPKDPTEPIEPVDPPKTDPEADKNEGENKDQINTGDVTNTLAWVSIAGVTGLGLVCIATKLHAKKEN